MKLKNLKKKIRRIEKRLQEGPQKLAKLKQKLQEAERAKVLKAARKSAAGATAARPAAEASLTEKKPAAPTSKTKHPVVATKAKRKRNLSPERRAQLSAAMKARWAARRAAEASLKTASRDDQHSAPEPNP
jgi:predicted  nucleic acid-binding Zn-ribbon protein